VVGAEAIETIDATEVKEGRRKERREFGDLGYFCISITFDVCLQYCVTGTEYIYDSCILVIARPCFPP
jgi:hypothetical protein